MHERLFSYPATLARYRGAPLLAERDLLECRTAAADALDGWYFMAHFDAWQMGRFTSLSHARIVIEAWRRESNEERPKRALGGLTPSQYARQLAEKTVTV